MVGSVFCEVDQGNCASAIKTPFSKMHSRILLARCIPQAGASALLAALLLLLCGAAHPQAAGYPERAVRIVVPFPAGGGSDLLARLLSQELGEAFQRPFVVENRAGAGGNIGMELVARAAPDGLTLALANNTVTINQSLGHPPFDAGRDLTAVVLVGATPPMIGVASGFAATSVRQLIVMARAAPGAISYASCGSGTAHHLAAELLQSMAGVRMTHVPYKGCSQAVTDVLNGQVPVAFSTVSVLAPHVKSGRIRGLATTGLTRAQSVSDVPTVAESCYPGYVVDTWFGLMGPAGMPSPVVARLNAEVNRALARPEIIARLREQYFEPIGGTSEHFAEQVRRELQTYGKLVREANIQIVD